MDFRRATTPALPRAIETPWGGMRQSLALREREIDGQRLHDLSGWVLADDPAMQPSHLVVADADEQRVFAIDRQRMDVMRALRLEATALERQHCGLVASWSRPISNESELRILLRVGDQDHPITTIRTGPPPFITGRDRWLFLAGDSNDSVAQFTRDFVPDPDWTSGWQRYFNALDAQRSGLPPIRFLVAPSKEELFADRYPLPRADKTMLDVFQERHGHVSGVLDARALLMAQRDLCYDAGDTHWNDFAGALVVEAVFGGPSPLIEDYPLKAAQGDLWAKAWQPGPLERRFASRRPQLQRVFDNGVIHHGNVMVLETPEAPRGTVLLFGGSSLDAMRPALTRLYRRVVSVYSAGSLDPALIAAVAPEQVLLQTNQRFLARAPLFEQSTQKVIAAKMKQGAVVEAQRIENPGYAAWDGRSSDARPGFFSGR